MFALEAISVTAVTAAVTATTARMTVDCEPNSTDSFLPSSARTRSSSHFTEGSALRLAVEALGSSPCSSAASVHGPHSSHPLVQAWIDEVHRAIAGHRRHLSRR